MTIFIIILTAAISIMAFNNRNLMDKCLFNPYQVVHRKEYYRLITHAFLHADWTHLIVNMIVLYSFGRGSEYYFGIFFGDKKYLFFPLLYVGGTLIATLYALAKNRDNPSYNAVGASGAVSAVVFACIFFAPLNKILLFGLVPMPGILYGFLYLGYSWYMSKRGGGDNIAHDAHFWGAVFGFIFPLIVDYRLIYVFLEQVHL